MNRWIQPTLFELPEMVFPPRPFITMNHMPFRDWLYNVAQGEDSPFGALPPISYAMNVYNDQCYKDEIKWKEWCDGNSEEKSTK